jgi:hypothetical protein
MTDQPFKMGVLLSVDLINIESGCVVLSRVREDRSPSHVSYDIQPIVINYTFQVVYLIHVMRDLQRSSFHSNIKVSVNSIDSQTRTLVIMKYIEE